MAYFNDRIIDAVWEKAKKVEGYNPDIWRQDFANAWIRKDLYGAKHPFGWAIDHIKPVSKNGTSDMPNLEPLQWQNNIQKEPINPPTKSPNCPHTLALIGAELS